MNRALEPMQFVLDLLSDSIIEASTASPVTTQIGYLTPDQIQKSRLPFVQVFAPTTAKPETDLTQSTGELTFQVEYMDSSVEQSEADEAEIIDAQQRPLVDIQRVIDALGHTLSVDSTMRGLVANARVSDATVYVTAREEAQGCLITIICELAEDNRSEWVEYVDFSDTDKFLALVGTSEIEDSKLIPNALGVKRLGGLNSVVKSDSVTDPTRFPIDFTASKIMRLLLWQDKQASIAAVNIEVRIGQRNSGSPLIDYRRYLETRSWHGWQEIVFQLDNPFQTVGTPGDLDEVRAIEFISANFGAPSTTTFGLVYVKFGFYPRDRGDNNGQGYQAGL